MEHRSSFIRLVESATRLDHDIESFSFKQATLFLLDFAHRREALETEGAWRLSSSVARKLEKESGYKPPGGWQGLAGLLAGTPHLRATREAFVPQTTPGNLAASEDELRRELVEAMTVKLVPPATAASIFIALSVHPAWGLRLAWEIQHSHHGDASDNEPELIEHLPLERLEPVREGVYAFIALVVGALRRLEARKAYPLDAFGRLLADAARYAREKAEKVSASSTPGHLQCFTGGVRVQQRIALVLARDLLDDVFVPAGIARDVGDGSFAIVTDVLDNVLVDELERNRQDRIFEDFVSSRGQFWGGGAEARR